MPPSEPVATSPAAPERPRLALLCSPAVAEIHRPAGRDFEVVIPPDFAAFSAEHDRAPFLAVVAEADFISAGQGTALGGLAPRPLRIMLATPASRYDPWHPDCRIQSGDLAGLRQILAEAAAKWVPQNPGEIPRPMNANALPAARAALAQFELDKASLKTRIPALARELAGRLHDQLAAARELAIREPSPESFAAALETESQLAAAERATVAEVAPWLAQFTALFFNDRRPLFIEAACAHYHAVNDALAADLSAAEEARKQLGALVGAMNRVGWHTSAMSHGQRSEDPREQHLRRLADFIARARNGVGAWWPDAAIVLAE